MDARKRQKAPFAGLIGQVVTFCTTNSPHHAQCCVAKRPLGDSKQTTCCGRLMRHRLPVLLIYVVVSFTMLS